MSHDWSRFVGQVVDGRYPLEQFLGVAERKAVFRTLHNGKPAVLKLADDAPAADSWKISSTLKHPNLVNTFTAGHATLDAARLPYAVHEFPDDDLGQTIPRRALTPDEARPVLDALLSALAYLHGKGFAHRNVKPASVYAFGNSIKLVTDDVALAAPADVAADIRALGSTVVEVLTQHAPEGNPRRDPRVNALPAPYREIAIRCLDDDPNSRWTLEDIDQLLRPPQRKRDTVPPAVVTAAPAARIQQNRKLYAVVFALGALGIVAALLTIFGSRKDSPRAAEPVQATRQAQYVPPPTAPLATERPSPVDPEPLPQRSRTAPEAAPKRSGSGSWAVIAATYGSHEAAEKRASTLRNRWPQFKPSVFPEKSDARYYYVVLGTGMSQQEAESLQRRARGAGMPADTYVTKLAR